MIDRKLIIAQIENFHFSWMNDEFRKYFREVVVTSSLRDPYPAKEDDVLLVNACLNSFTWMKCRLKFGILLPGFGLNPFKYPDHLEKMRPILEKYDAVFCDEAPVWEAVKRNGGFNNFHLVPICANSRDFRKTRKRDKFRRIIQVASHGKEKGREISMAAMKMMPYDWELIPGEDEKYFLRSQSQMVDILQGADGFLHPGTIGGPPGYFVDGKYTVSLIEAGMSGCIVFWHDAMGVGNSMKTVFEVSLNPIKIAERIKDVVGSIDLDKHSDLTAEEFRDKYSIENTVKAKMEVMMKFM